MFPLLVQSAASETMISFIQWKLHHSPFPHTLPPTHAHHTRSVLAKTKSHCPILHHKKPSSGPSWTLTAAVHSWKGSFNRMSGIQIVFNFFSQLAVFSLGDLNEEIFARQLSPKFLQFFCLTIDATNKNPDTMIDTIGEREKKTEHKKELKIK